jgi:DNA polymerase-3 subunit alpha
MDDSKEKLLNLCVSGMAAKGLLGREFKDRLKVEIKEIENQAEYDYFLELYEKRAKFQKNENNLLVPYLLGLTDEFDISSEPAHIQGEFPDIDVDYLPVVQEYLRKDWCPRRFGRDKVVNIGNYGTFGIKSALLDMARVHSADYQEIQTITKNLQDKDDEGKPLTWDKALEVAPDLAAYCEKNPEIADSAKRLIDRNRGRGKHAGGTVVSNINISDLVPVMIDTDGNPVSGWTEGLHDQDLQPVGLIKFDILAVKDLLRIAHCCHLVKQRHPEVKSISAVEGGSDWSNTSYLNDRKALELANKAETRGIFQFDGEGMRKLIKAGGVERFEDLVAYSALFRPAAIGMRMHERYVERKRGREDWEDQIPDCIKSILAKTYGVMCVEQHSFISMSDGSECEIKNVKAGDFIHTLNEQSGSFENKEVLWCGFTKKDDGIKLVLENGYGIIVTKDHKVLTFDGWKEAQDLREDDLVAIPTKLDPKESSQEPLADWLGSDEDVAYLIGVLVGDGCLTSSGVTICTGLKDQHDKLKAYLEGAFPKIKFVEYFNVRSWYLRLVCSELVNKKPHGNRKNKINLMVDEMDLRHTSRLKHVPSVIMKSKNTIRRAFLAGLFDSDGTLWVRDIATTCVITSTSELVLNDVRKLLLMEGIQSHIRTDRVYIWNSELLSQILNPYLVLKKIVGKLLSGTSTRGWIPRRKLREVLVASGLSERQFQNNFHIDRQHFRKSKHSFLRRDKAAHVVDGLNDNLLYLRLKHKSIVENRVFYDISVKENHNFVANGIVVHNCYQEQIMKILNVVGDIPLIHCEKIRKAISKKKTSEFAKYKQMFLENGSKKTGWPIESDDEKNLNFLWNLISSFSAYGFNASHAVAYTHTSSRLLYLKAHYPLEFFCSTLGLEGDEDKVKMYKREAERSGIKINRCDLNKSKVNYEIVGEEIYVGFSNIKGIGKEVAERIVSLQPFSGFPDFLDRFGTDKRIVEPLVCLGAFKDAAPNVLLEFYEDYKKWSKGNIDKEKRQMKRREELAQSIKSMLKEGSESCLEHNFLMNVFESGDASAMKTFISKEFSVSDVFGVVKKYAKSALDFEHKANFSKANSISFENWTPQNRHPSDKWPNIFELERKYYGFSWEHPIQKSSDYIGGHSFGIFKDNDDVVNAGVEVMITKGPQEKKSKKGNKYHFVLVEDEDWNVEVVTFWSEDYARFKEELEYWNEEQNRGHFMRLRLTRPGSGFKSYTFESPSKAVRYKLIPADKKNDPRLQIMESPI